MDIYKRFICLILCYFLPAPSVFSDEPELLFMGLEDQIPYTFEENGVKMGSDYEMFLEVTERAGIRAKIELVPFVRALDYVQYGKADGIIQIYFTKEREDFLVYSQYPMHVTSISVFVKRGREFSFDTIVDLYGKRVGKQSGFFISSEFNQAVNKKQIFLDEVKTAQMNLKKLAAERIDCFVSNPMLVNYHLKHSRYLDEIVQLPLPLIPDKTVYLALSKRSHRIKDMEGLINRINNVMAEIINDGTYTGIERKYME